MTAVGGGKEVNFRSVSSWSTAEMTFISVLFDTVTPALPLNREKGFLSEALIIR